MTDPVYVTDALIAEDIDAYLAQHERKSLLRFITCGSVDDGKSTLIGRLLYDSKMIFEDQLAALEADSRRVGTQGQEIDFALLVDGLAAEREQGITIDVAYRFFTTEKRKFIVADTPGHEQYTRNMVTGASTADLAVILIDARKGVLTQTRRHSFLAHLLGIRHIVLAVNKMDLVGYDKAVFDRIALAYRAFASEIRITNFTAIPISGFKGDNITALSPNTPWFKGPALIEHLESVDVGGAADEAKPFRMPVQWVNRPNLDFRGFSGTVASGTVKVGDDLLVAASRKPARVARIVTMDGDLSKAIAGEAITIVLDREIDVSRGDVLAHPGQVPDFSNQFQARLVWMNEEQALPGRSYLLKLGSQVVPASITALKFRTNVNTLEESAARTLEMNEVGTVTIATDKPIAFDSYGANALTGSFILIDRISNATLGAGVIEFGLRRAQNLSYQSFDVNRKVRAELKGQTPQIVWFTGLSGSGKSTVANLIEKRLTADRRHAYILDGDNVRHGLNRDLGFTDGDRVENIRRVAEVARLMADAGLIVLVSFISPFTNERRLAREVAGDIRFTEVYVNTPLEVCEARDPKGLYAKARRGEIQNFTGISSPYEAPEHPDVTLHGGLHDPVHMAEDLYARIFDFGSSYSI